MRNNVLLLHFFSTFLNPQRDTVTYSALYVFLYRVSQNKVATRILLKPQFTHTISSSWHPQLLVILTGLNHYKQSGTYIDLLDLGKPIQKPRCATVFDDTWYAITTDGLDISQWLFAVRNSRDSKYIDLSDSSTHSAGNNLFSSTWRWNAYEDLSLASRISPTWGK